MRTIDSLPIQIINLLNYSYSIVEKLLEEQREFYPIGVYIDRAGKIINRLTFDMQNDFTNRLAAGSIAAYSIVYDARVNNERYKDPIDAAIANFGSNWLDSTGNCFMPYQIIKGKVKFLEPWIE